MTLPVRVAIGQTTFLDPRMGGLGLVGPATAHPASAFYNPAVMALKPGNHIYLEGSGLLASSQHAAAAVDPETGSPLSPRRLLDTRQQTRIFPSFYFLAQSDLGIDSVALGLSVSTPATTSYHDLRGAAADFFDPAAQGPGRYHATDLTLFHLFVTPAAAIKVTDQFYIGLSFSFVFGAIDFGFVRDTALQGGSRLDRDPNGHYADEYAALDDCGSGQRCDYGSDLAAEGVRVRGSASGVALGGGIVVRPHSTLDIGIGVQSGVVFGLGGRHAEGDAFVTRSAATLSAAEADPRISSPQRQLRGRGTIAYSLPNMIALGLAWRHLEPLTLDLQLRWVNNSVHEGLDIHLTGAEFRADPQIPDHIAHHQGLQDTFSFQLGGRYGFSQRLAVEVAAMIESPAVAADTISPLMIDGWKLDALVALRWTLLSYFTVRVGYGIRWIPAREVSSSAFSPAHMVECVDAFFDVDLPACQAAEAGRGLASTDGRYGLTLHRLSLSLAFDTW